MSPLATASARAQPVESEGLPAQELGCAVPGAGLCLWLHHGREGGYAALGTLPCVRSVCSLSQEAATPQHPLLHTPGSEPLSIQGARRPCSRSESIGNPTWRAQCLARWPNSHTGWDGSKEGESYPPSLSLPGRVCLLGLGLLLYLRGPLPQAVLLFRVLMAEY